MTLQRMSVLIITISVLMQLFVIVLVVSPLLVMLIIIFTMVVIILRMIAAHTSIRAPHPHLTSRSSHSHLTSIATTTVSTFMLVLLIVVIVVVGALIMVVSIVHNWSLVWLIGLRTLGTYHLTVSHLLVVIISASIVIRLLLVAIVRFLFVRRLLWVISAASIAPTATRMRGWPILTLFVMFIIFWVLLATRRSLIITIISLHGTGTASHGASAALLLLKWCIWIVLMILTRSSVSLFLMIAPFVLGWVLWGSERAFSTSLWPHWWLLEVTIASSNWCFSS